MHVAILAEFAVASGGAEKVAVESARGLAGAGVEVTFVQAVAGPADPLLDHPRLRRVCLGLSDVRGLPAWKGALAGVYNTEAARRLALALDALPSPPDCLHLHQWTRAFSPSVLPVLFARGVPVALTLHDHFLACPNGLHYRFDRAEPCTLRPLSVPCVTAPCDPQSRLHKLVRVGRGAAMRQVLGEHPLHVVHVCDASLERAGSLFAGLPLRHHRLDNPVGTRQGPPADPARCEAIAHVGRLTPEKGADLVAAAALLAGLPALFIGAGPLEESLRAQPGTEVLGWRSPAEVEATLRARARAVCAPSRWHETGPLTVYEALACGIPAIASTRSGAGEKVVDGLNGLTVEPSVGALAAAFTRLADDRLVERLGRAAHARYWAAPLSLEAHAEGLLGIYDAMLCERRIAARAAPIAGIAASASAQHHRLLRRS